MWEGGGHPMWVHVGPDIGPDVYVESAVPLSCAPVPLALPRAGPRGVMQQSSHSMDCDGHGPRAVYGKALHVLGGDNPCMFTSGPTSGPTCNQNVQGK